MRGIYTVKFTEQTIAAASGDYDFFELTPADDRPIELAALFLSNKSEISDAQEEMVSYSFVTDNATSGNGSSATPTSVESRDLTPGFTAETVGSTPASTGTAVTVHVATFNLRVGLELWIPEGFRARVDQADTMLCVRLLTALADDAVFSGTAYVREV